MKQETIFVLDSDEFDQLVKTSFPKHSDFEYLAETESANDSDHIYMKVGIPCQ